MNALAHLPSALQVPSLAGQSLEDAILETEPNEPGANGIPRVNQVDTLSAEDGVADANLDDRLLHRDLKARIFGADGRVTIGRYEVLRRIGRGGMGTVYVAHDPELDRKIALKVLRADRRSGRERMLQEARALARLAHPNVVAVHEVGLHDERVFVAMELVEGKTLRTWLEARPSRTAIYQVFLQAARGLQAAHRAGLVHRDFKPDNVLIGDDGRVRVVDFGVAKATDSLEPAAEGQSQSAGSSGSMPELTLTGQLLGTPAYMAAEQFMGASVDARTDVFAFGVTLYEALTGRRPFDGDDTASVSWSVLHGEARPLEASDVPAGLVALVRQSLAREAERRPASLDGFVAALEAAIAPARPRRARSLRVAGALLSAAALGGGVLVMGSEPGDGDSVGPAAMAVVGPTEAEEDPAEVAAFAAIVAATDDARRIAAAEAYLEHHEGRGPAAHRATAHSVVGDALWRASCPKAVLGLCVEEPTSPAAGPQCSTPARGAFVRRKRDDAKAKAALVHLDQSLELASAEPPKPEAERQLFGTAIGRARVQRADHRLEEFLDVKLPASLDFEGARALSSDAFKLFYSEKSRLGMELMSEYAAVKKAQAPHWVLVAAGRTGMLGESFASSLMTAPLPADMSDEDQAAYCGALEEFTAPSLDNARSAYAYCSDKAKSYGIELPEVQMCRERLAALGEPEADAAAPKK